MWSAHLAGPPAAAVLLTSLSDGGVPGAADGMTRTANAIPGRWRNDERPDTVRCRDAWVRCSVSDHGALRTARA
jgi:hypothetical protein